MMNRFWNTMNSNSAGLGKKHDNSDFECEKWLIEVFHIVTQKLQTFLPRFADFECT